MIKVGKQNLITDVPGIRVGNIHDQKIRSGVTVIIPDEPAVAAADIRGGGPGSRETEALNPDCLVDVVHGIVLSGGSAFGLDAAGGVMASLKEKRIGKTFDLGNVGAGYGAIAGGLKGGLGSASFVFFDGKSEITLGAIAAVNSMGSLTMPGSPTMWAFPYEQNQELGNQPMPAKTIKMDLDFTFELPVGKNTTLVTVATDAALTKPQARRVAIMAQDGLARGVYQAQSLGDLDSYRDRYGS